MRLPFRKPPTREVYDTISPVGATEEQMAAMRTGLRWAESSTLEQMLIDHICLCWLRHNETEWWYHHVMEKVPSLKIGEFWEKRLSASQKRYLRSCETLAKVRKLLRPDKNPIFAMQVNQEIHT